MVQLLSWSIHPLQFLFLQLASCKLADQVRLSEIWSVEESVAYIDTFLIPWLCSYLNGEKPAVMPHKEFIHSLLSSVEELWKLAACFTRWEINTMNIIIADAVDISGTLDWEEAR